MGQAGSGAAELAVKVGQWKPCAALVPFVEDYALREDRLGALEIYHPLPARSDCFLQFYLEDRYRVVTVATGAVHRAPRCVLVGPQTRRREDLIWTGCLKIFTIRFTAVGLRALFGISASAVCNFAGSAELALGAPGRHLESLVGEAKEGERVAVVERFLLHRLASGRVAEDGGIALRMVRAMRARHGAMAVGAVGERFGLSVRQVERTFQEHVGVTPKMFGKLERLKLAMQRIGPETDWAEIAASAGYFDQSHMGRDFRELNGATPVEFAELGMRAKQYGSDVAFVLSRMVDRRLT